jgi:hypothetical protein
MKAFEVVSITLLALLGGMYWGPWLALTRSLATFTPETLLVIVKRLSLNMAPLMTFLTPVALLSTVPILLLSYGTRPATFYLTLGGLALFAFTLLVTLLIEVPIVKRLEVPTVAALPANWRQLRDRWVAFHLFRVVPALAGLVLLLIGAIS